MPVVSVMPRYPIQNYLVSQISGVELPNKIQPGELFQWVVIWTVRDINGSSWRNPNGNLNVPELWNDNDGRKLNLNYDNPDNKWNENYRFLAFRQLFCERPDIRRVVFIARIFSIHQSFVRFHEGVMKLLNTSYDPEFSYPRQDG